MRISKFGGGLLATPEDIRRSISIIQKRPASNRINAAVVSAMGSLKGEHKVTDQLMQMARRASEKNEAYQDPLQQLIERHHQTIQELLSPPEQARLSPWFESETSELRRLMQSIFCIGELSEATLDDVVSFGERFSGAIFTGALRSNDIPAEYVDARELIVTDDHFGDAEVSVPETDEKIRRHFEKKSTLQVVTGFIARTYGKSGKPRTTTLGRDGSDYTAAILAAALHSPEDPSEIEIWKEFAIHTANPKKVKKTKIVRHLTYREAGELSNQGMSAVHSRTTIPARRKKIPIFVKSSENPDDPGTRIDGDPNGDSSTVKAISSISNVAQFNLTGAGMQDKKGLARRVFGALEAAGISASFIVQISSEQSVSFTIPTQDAEKGEKALRKELKHELETIGIDSIEYHSNRTMIAIVGEKMKGQKGTLAMVAATLAKKEINIISMGQSPDEFNITIIVRADQEQEALQALHDTFLGDAKKILLLIGIDQIGKALLDKLQALEQNADMTLDLPTVLNPNS